MSEDLLELIVAQRVSHPGDIISLDLARPSGRELPPFEPGAHVDVHVAPGIVRQYSLYGDPADASRYRLGVLLDPASRGGSAAIHREMLPGALVRVGTPRNHFPLAATAGRSLLVAGGVGITPLMCMARGLRASRAEFLLHYCTRSFRRTAFLEELAASGLRDTLVLHHDDEGDAQRFDPLVDLPIADGETHLYVCGPVGFMDWVIAGARNRGYAERHIHREYFGSVVDSSGGAFEVVAAKSGITVTVPEGRSIARLLLAEGVDLSVSCEEGVCGACLVNVIEGVPDHRDVYLTEQEKAANDQMLICCSRSKSQRLVLDL